MIIAVRFQALVAPADPKQARVGLQDFAQAPVRRRADVVQQKIGVVDQQQQAQPLLIGYLIDGGQTGSGLLSHRQAGNTLDAGIQRQRGQPAQLQGIDQAIEDIGPELPQRADGVLLFRKAQGELLALELGVVINCQRQTLHQR